ncbi:MAG: Rieske (2Fe-2S) protein [Methanomethylovorans sp.]|uniref:Rieske (2Fe-2S) protein n=1 Tax=Methanomethylovorans sp. TaxID=2758717 RepID=UPI000A761CA1|nr:Rieske (2Fe-2S) protein [Methanomethylovorans sp.]
MSEENWVYALELAELADGEKKALVIGGQRIALIRKANEIFAISNKCVHMDCPLSRGELEGYIIKCPCHDWRFDIRSGEFLDAREIKVSVYELKLSDGKIYLKMEGENQ